MNSVEENRVFPFHRIWEDFGPDQHIQWEHLEGNCDAFDAVRVLAKFGKSQVPDISEDHIRAIARRWLGTKPSVRLVSRLDLLTGWQLLHDFRERSGMNLPKQRLVMKRLAESAHEFRIACDQASGDLLAVLRMMQPSEPERLLNQDQELNFSFLSCAAHDVALVASRAHDDTAPKRTGRNPVWRRDTMVRLATEAIEAETGQRIQSSRGNKSNPAPHFSNAGGRLLLAFFKMLASNSEERLLVQSVARAQSRRGDVQNNSRKSP